MLSIVIGFGPGTDRIGYRWEHKYIQLNFVQVRTGQGSQMVAVPLSLQSGGITLVLIQLLFQN